MNPNETLAELRRATKTWEDADSGSRTERHAAEEATSAAAALDDWLCHGGILPDDWHGSIVPTAVDIAGRGGRMVMAAEPAMRADVEVILPGAFDAQLAAEVPMTNSAGERIGTARLAREGDRIVAEFTAPPLPAGATMSIGWETPGS